MSPCFYFDIAETVFLCYNKVSNEHTVNLMRSDNESAWDKLLQIKTVGRDDTNADEYRYPYEPTPYSVLERLASTGLIGKGDVVLDYGCGKGRAGSTELKPSRSELNTMSISTRARSKTAGPPIREQMLTLF